jgi:hypothetical protein
MSLVWFKMVAQIEVEEPDIVLVEDLVAWLSNTEDEKPKREKCRRQLESRVLLADCVERVLDLGLYSATLTTSWKKRSPSKETTSPVSCGRRRAVFSSGFCQWQVCITNTRHFVVYHMHPTQSTQAHLTVLQHRRRSG